MSFARENIREYNRVHQHMFRHHKKSGKCEFCGVETITQWSNKSGKYLLDEDPYATRSDWQELCRKCHRRYDLDVLKIVIGRGKNEKIPQSGIEYVYWNGRTMRWFASKTVNGVKYSTRHYQDPQQAKAELLDKIPS